ncbi:hypothetical protein VTJ04DRAFT_6686 [Mycothermus thermophilus]|uniref:uncharacterized protein n=1 Tax=Humicola insolens TaxID=85995 RepID=UPI0037422776
MGLLLWLVDLGCYRGTQMNKIPAQKKQSHCTYFCTSTSSSMRAHDASHEALCTCHLLSLRPLVYMIYQSINKPPTATVLSSLHLVSQSPTISTL